MKKVLFTLALLLTLSMGLQAAGQKHRHTPRSEQVDSTKNDSVEVFSDTTSTTKYSTSVWDDEDDFTYTGMIHNALSDMRGKDVAGMFFVLCVLLIIFVLAPVFIIIALFYFINKNRKEKMRLAQMAMQQGQPIPDGLLKDKDGDFDNSDYQRGMRQCFVGVGLMIFLGFAAGTVGFGIGALVFCIGLGKVFAGKTANRRAQDERDLNSQNRREYNDNITQNNYD